MKKLMIGVIVMIATSGVLCAQNTKPGNGTPGTNKNMSTFVDANKNGVCDTYESTAGAGVRGSGQGPRMNKGQGALNGKGNGQCTPGKRSGNRGCRIAS